ncbi:Isoleucine--tRNA ligase [Podosphaera aphanis]|nr:Isoleucine--tRNA ligase [Podosphaera aphanis]
MVLRSAPKGWSSTLRLPKSTFPPRPSTTDQANLIKRCSDDLYEWQSRERSHDAPFILHDGPPYANGELHVGHALNKILKDMICRVKIQQGKRIVFIPGWDCHGLPIEIKALEHRSKLGNRNLDAISVRNAARALASETMKLQMTGFREWGVMADWSKAWNTMEKSYEINQLRIFQSMARDGFIFRRYKPVYWSPYSRTALAEAELEYKNDHVSKAAYVKFSIKSVPESLRSKLPDNVNLHAVVWTTTPWTLTANRAIAVHPELEYVVLKHDSEHFLIASSRVKEIKEILFGEDNVDTILESIVGSELDGAQYCSCLADTENLLITTATFVSANTGTGLVHLAPGHGQDDYETCTRLGIKAVSPVDDAGCFTSEAYPQNPSRLEGKPVLTEGTNCVIEILGKNVLAVHKYKHKYPYDWRNKLPVIMRATEQWFADVGRIKEKALNSIKEVRFIPELGRSRLESFVRSRSEWCISRQRAWGVPIPALYTEDGEAVLTDESVAHIIIVIKERGIDAWWTDPPDDPAWVPPGYKGKYNRGKDTMDVWFDSGTSWTQTGTQADVYLEGTDQHRGWFQSSLLTHASASKRHTAPFKTLMTHGFTLDQIGKKMSKSLGNVIAPIQIMDGSLLPPAKKNKSGVTSSQGLGPDALRLWVASSDYTRDVVISQPVLKVNNAALLKFRMVLKMLLGSMNPTDENTRITLLDQIARIQLEAVMTQVESSFNNFEFYKAVNSIVKWINVDLSAFYLEAMKDRLYCGDGGGVLDEIFQGFLKMLTPITPLLVEECWSHRPEWMQVRGDAHPFHRNTSESIIRASRTYSEPAIEAEIPWLMNASTAVKSAQEKARAQKLMGSSLECAVVLQLPPAATSVFQRYADELDSMFVVSSVEFGSSPITEWIFSAEFDAPGGMGTAWVSAPKGHKCPRCWRYVAPVSEQLCARCEHVISSTT